MSGRKGSGDKKKTLIYPKHFFKPEDLLTFIELEGFVADWERLGLDDGDLAAVQILIMCAPDAAAVIKGTGGLRKVRFAPRRWNTGKSGAARICYVYFSEFSTVLLVVAYSKDEQDNIPAGHRAAFKRLIEHVHELLSTRTYR